MPKIRADLHQLVGLHSVSLAIFDNSLYTLVSSAANILNVEEMLDDISLM